MPRTKRTEQTVFQFSELSESAKENAMSWYRHGMENDDYSESVIDDAVTCLAFLGITIDTRPVKLMGGGTRQDPIVYWSLHSQGAGASFAGRYEHRPGGLTKLFAYAPQDAELKRIAYALQDVQRRYFYKLSARISVSGHGEHSGSARFDVTNDRTGSDIKQADEETVIDALRDCMDWIYHSLEREYDYQTSDAIVAENITANEYEFDEEGNRA